ncbi:hypothetical protein TWF225_009952 [Orbilia oligospora]|uniref:Uncharacterized protein n=1 Tax=Orbilia oligospora TaxID=2813651 RepID=A0A7C8TV24_ORBOL|nr:hypothetical protein TWF225_009952 [Orbilia oligospora]KAF3182115.1 hypothetical protein TWF751_007166 [Orbilia oligospora]KAF3236706.1 hypothetical protein TWF128_001283 [Orbilia oligospora]KAF3237556.1 hypothetical protein TWF217_002081 [Orbilia oligospora]KAF3285868.1 hypothetical protein TWF132_009083 [Orbilia oligospora]
MGFHAKEFSYASWEYETQTKTASTTGTVERPPLPHDESDNTDNRAPFEKLPVEIYDQIFSYLVPQEPPTGYKRRNSDLSAVLKTSRTLYAATLFTIFQNAMFPHSPVYSKFLEQITNHPVLGGMVRRMDFSQYTSVGLGRTGRMNMEMQNLTAKTLTKGLRATGNLREFLAQEALGPDIDASVLEELFFTLPLLEAVDFCGASASRFKEAFTEVMHPWNPKLPESFPVQRLSLHECTTLATSVFTAILPRLPNLTHLDLSHTQVTDSALMSIPETANITHLSLSKCARLKGENVVTFLLEHPAVRNLKVLNLHYDASRYRLLSAIDVEDLLPNLPKSLVSLNLTGASISSDHMPMLLPLVSRLEELSLGHTELTMEDINTFFVPQWKSNLRYLDLTGISAVSPNALHFSTGAILPQNTTLQVLELSEKNVTGCAKLHATKTCGWSEQSYGRRSWLVKSNTHDDGERSWKMGSKKWGNRKIPCNFGEVGGIYAYYGLAK